MDHLLAVLPVFGLRAYQSVSGQLSPADGVNMAGKPSIKVPNNAVQGQHQ